MNGLTCNGCGSTFKTEVEEPWLHLGYKVIYEVCAGCGRLLGNIRKIETDEEEIL